MNSVSLISIVTPMYNAEKYIRETINSVVSQTYENWEMIIVDNFSTDNSRDIVNKINDKRVKLIELDYNSGGPARPRNIGVENAKGEYIAFLDADDVWYSFKLEKQIEYLNINKIQFTSSDCSLIDEDSHMITLSKISSFFNKRVATRNICDLIKNNFIITSSVLMHKDLISDFSEDKKLMSVEDFDLWLRVLNIASDQYRYQKEKLLEYRVVEGSASDRNDILKQELKSHIVISSFLLDNNRYIRCWWYRLVFHLLRQQIKPFFKSSKDK